MKSEFTIRSIAVCFAATLTLAASPIHFTITDLGSLGGATAVANAVNNSGQTAATMSNSKGGLRAIFGGTDVTPPGATDAMASSMNNSGKMAGTTYINGAAQATEWSNGTAQYLGTLGGLDSYATGINDQNQVTGLAVTGLGFGHAFLNTAGVMTDLGVLAGGSWSSGYAVNASGQVAGYGDTSGGAFRGFLWKSGKGFTQLGTLGGQNSYAMSLNASGTATGSAQVASGYLHAFTYDGAMHDLGTLGGNNSRGYGINASGSIVGYSDTQGSDTHAFLYQNGSLFDLNTLLTGSSGWTLTAAYGISDNGQIAGSGWYNGVEHAVLLNPVVLPQAVVAGAAVVAPDPVPEPGTLTLFAIGAGLIAAATLLQNRLTSSTSTASKTE